MHPMCDCAPVVCVHVRVSLCVIVCADVCVTEWLKSEHGSACVSVKVWVYECVCDWMCVTACEYVNSEPVHAYVCVYVWWQGWAPTHSARTLPLSCIPTECAISNVLTNV
jgi:hypothetical protein